MPHLTPGAGGGCSELDWSYNARLPKRDTLELGTLKFIDAREDVLLLGQPGTGKSHVGEALALLAVERGYKVLYREVHQLIEDITEVRELGVLRKVRAQLRGRRSSLQTGPSRTGESSWETWSSSPRSSTA